MQKLITNTSNIFDKMKKPSYLQYWNVNNLYGWSMSGKLSVNSFGCIENTSQINEDFIKSYNEESDKRYFFKAYLHYTQTLHELHNDVPFLPEKTNLSKIKKLVSNPPGKNEYVTRIRNQNKH